MFAALAMNVFMYILLLESGQGMFQSVCSLFSIGAGVALTMQNQMIAAVLSPFKNRRFARRFLL
jgi:hypothetical protein